MSLREVKVGDQTEQYGTLKSTQVKNEKNSALTSSHSIEELRTMEIYTNVK